MTKRARKTRSDKGKTRNPYRKKSTHIRIDEDKKYLLVRIAKMPIEFIKEMFHKYV